MTSTVVLQEIPSRRAAVFCHKYPVFATHPLGVQTCVEHSARINSMTRMAKLGRQVREERPDVSDTETSPASPTSTLDPCRNHQNNDKSLASKTKRRRIPKDCSDDLSESRKLRSMQSGFKVQERLCITLKPTREEFSKPFAEFVEGVFRESPDCPCFKVVAPKGWRPRQQDYDFSTVNIGAPIKQHVFGRSGSYMCILEEQRSMNGSAYAAMAQNSSRAPPEKKHGDLMMERSFWSSITMNPPIYGADTPMSLFDEEIPWGWNLRDLRCMFSEYDVPEIAGVTSPMTYFGMWKAFFAWHKEDLDLYSINYLHTGAPKVWYCVPPSESDKFDAMARQLFPEGASACSEFVRHKNMMISPSLLRSYNIDYVQALQHPGEFIVLNASSYHAGYNLGFNCAEAVNFALPKWIEIGKDCSQCDCGAMADGVSLDMSIFIPGLYDSSSASEDFSEETVGEEQGTSTSDSGHEIQSEAEDQSESVMMHASSIITRTRKRGRPLGSKNKRKRLGHKNSDPMPSLQRQNDALRLPREAVHITWGSVVDAKPIALVSKTDSNEKTFTLVHRLYRPASRPDSAWFGILEKGSDNLYWPKGETILVQFGMSSLPKTVNVRTEWVCPENRRRGAWKLLSKESRILM